MARRERIHIPNAFYHVMLRGNAGKRLFYSDMDCCRFCLLLQEGVERFRHAIHAYCLMSNHVHLLVQAGENSISKAMQNVAFRYSRYLNKKQDLVGHQFQGRYRCLLVQDDRYLWQVTKYIHLNPVKAGMVLLPEHYEWSSHNAYTGSAMVPWIKRDFILSTFSANIETAQKRYVKFVNEIIGDNEFEEIEKPKHDACIIGDETFVERICQIREKDCLAKKLNFEDIIQAVAHECNMEPDEILSSVRDRKVVLARSIIGYFCVEVGCLNLSDLAKLCKRQLSTLSEQVASIREKVRTNESVELIIKIKKIKHSLGV